VNRVIFLEAGEAVFDVLLNQSSQNNGSSKHRLSLTARSQNVTDKASTSSRPALNLPMAKFLGLPSSAATTPSPQNGELTAQELDTLQKSLETSVVKIQAVAVPPNWFQPYLKGQETQLSGSGFAVMSRVGDQEDPVFITGAQTVQDASSVQVQFPRLGTQLFDAYVPMTWADFDLAIVRLKSPQKLAAALENQTEEMQLLDVQPDLHYGLQVVASGYTDEHPALTLNQGAIIGSQDINGLTCFGINTTVQAPPGIGGGPVLAFSQNKSLRLVGMRTDAGQPQAVQTKNRTFAVPAVHVAQLLEQYATQEAKTHGSVEQQVSSLVAKSNATAAINESRSRTFQHEEVQLAHINAVTIEASSSLYESSGGCSQGVFLSRILETSPLRFARPEVPERSFLLSVNNITLDNLGMGQAKELFDAPAHFETLLDMLDNPMDPVSLRVCYKGKDSSHKMTMAWRDEYEPGIKFVREPHFSKSALDYEAFAGVTLMQMSLNHVYQLLSTGQYPTMGSWLVPKNQLKPRLLITHVEPETYASHLISPGMLVESINGANVSTLSDFREHFEPSGKAWTLETDQGVLVSVPFHDALAKQLVQGSTLDEMSYLLTPAVKKAQRLGSSGNTSDTPALATSTALQTDDGSKDLQVHKAQQAVAFAAAAEKLALEAKAQVIAITQNLSVANKDQQEPNQRSKGLRASFLSIR